MYYEPMLSHTWYEHTYGGGEDYMYENSLEDVYQYLYLKNTKILPTVLLPAILILPMY